MKLISFHHSPLVVLLILIGACDIANAASLSFANAVIADSPYAYYRLGESGGVTAADSSGNGRTATYVNGPTLGETGAAAAATGDTAAGFDGSNDYMTLDNLSAFGSQLTAFSLELIFKTTTTSSKSLLGELNQSTSTAFFLTLNRNYLDQSSSDNTRLFMRSAQGRQLSVSFAADLNDGEYHHLVMTYSVGNVPVFYVDGAAAAVSVGDNAIRTTDTFNTFQFTPVLGGLNNRGTISAGAVMVMDEAAFYTSVLSASDVTAHYNAIVPEPAGIVLMGLGVMLMAAGRRKA